MEVIVNSHITAEHVLSVDPNQWDTICITNSDQLMPNGIQKYSKSYLQLVFDDVDCPFNHYVMPNKNDVEKALEYAKGKEKIMVTCPYGLTRAPSIAYVINYKNNPKQALAIINQHRHYPNKLVVELAAQILDDREIYENFVARRKK